MKITLVQGDDSPIYRFRRRDVKGKTITTLPKKMWITFKSDCSCVNCLFQKKLEDNSITYSQEDNYYRFRIKSNETCHLGYGIYGYDIAIINEAGEKKTLLKNGELEITKQFTKKCNEV